MASNHELQNRMLLKGWLCKCTAQRTEKPPELAVVVRVGFGHLFQWMIMVVLILFGDMYFLMDNITFMMNVYEVLTTAGLLHLRWRNPPDIHRPLMVSETSCLSKLHFSPNGFGGKRLKQSEIPARNV